MFLLTVVSFIVVMSVIVFVHEFGHLLAAKRSKIVVEEFGFGFPPRVVKLFERGGTLYSINAIPFGGFCRMRGEDDPSLPGSFAVAPKRARLLTLVAGAGMNFLFAILMFTVLSMMQGVLDPSQTGVIVESIQPGSPASAAGFQAKDRIIAADGAVIDASEDLTELTSANPGRVIAYTVVRVDPATAAEQNLELRVASQMSEAAGKAVIGISVGLPTRPAKLWEAAWDGVKGTAGVIYQTFAIPANLIREGKPLSGAGFMGPVGIATMTGKVVQQSLGRGSLELLILYLGLLSTALGVTNLLPLPALDGGRVLFILVEAIRGKRIEPEREGLVHMIGFGLLLLLVGLLTVKEIGQLINHSFPALGF